MEMWRDLKEEKYENIAYEWQSRRWGGKHILFHSLDQFPTGEVELAVFEDGIGERSKRVRDKSPCVFTKILL